MDATFKAIPRGILNRFAKITSRMKINSLMKVNEIYPGHANALMKSGLSPKLFLSEREVWRKEDTSKLINDARH